MPEVGSIPRRNDRLAILDKKDFDNLLDWLHPDRDLAAQEYFKIHAALVKLFRWRGYFDAEDLADDVINRVSVKAEVLIKDYVGERLPYVLAVARNVIHECERRPPHQPLQPNMKVTDPRAHDGPDERTALRECLRKCLRKLGAKDREHILSYYRRTGLGKIDAHRAMAEQLGIATNALRVRVYRVRRTLKRCVEECMKKRRS